MMVSSLTVEVNASEIDISLLVRTQATSLDQALLEELTSTLPADGQVTSTTRLSVISMADVEKSTGHSGMWTLKPWIAYLARSEASLPKQRKRRREVGRGGQRWFVFLEPRSRVDPTMLSEVLADYDAREPLFIGRALRDFESSIVHHYSTEPPYPLIHAGAVLSVALVQMLAAQLKKNPHGGGHGQQIEPVWELAKWILHDNKIPLTNRSDAFCRDFKAGCATWVSKRESQQFSFGLSPKEVVIGVKTVGGLHDSRIPLVHEVWGASSPAEVLFLSNESYAGVPGANVIDLSPEFGRKVDPSVESTPQGSGHCAKMEAILAWMATHRPGKRWYVVTDDDTLINVPQLLHVLGEHDDSKAIYMGERYGWNHGADRTGTNYMTTGAGMALSAPALNAVMDCSFCVCDQDNAPDDMTLGMWFAQLDVELVHEEGFHQSEPHNFHPEVLSVSGPAVSFHRFNFRERVSDAEKLKRRRQNWLEWSRVHFSWTGAKAPASSEL
jgi:hypothetical protein